MASNKENARPKIETRIPLPLQPLPPLPIHLLNKTGNKENRFPLKTISQANILPSTSKEATKKEKSFKEVSSKRTKIKIDTKHVTLRESNKNYNVYKDHSEIILISDDEDKDIGEEIYFSKNRDRNTFDARLAITPVEKSVQNKQIRNIKRSLKRPHSRELQGLSPTEKQEKREEDKAKRRLVFNESLQDRLQSPDYWSKAYMLRLEQDYTDDLLGHLLNTERPPVPGPTLPQITRACVINWLMKVNGPFGNPAVVQTACWYLDSILGTDSVQLDKLQLVAAACHWIAQKIHGPVLHASRLVKCANNAFTQEMLLRAEKAILQKLGFPPQPVIPHEYITYLSWWCDNNEPGQTEVAATFLCLSGLMVSKELCDVCPSVLACAAIRNAVLLLRRKDLMRRLQECPLYKAGETKASSLSHIGSLLRKSVRTVADPSYEYKAPLEHYGVPPHYIAQQIISSARQCFHKPC